MSPVALARSSAGSIAIRFVLPVLLMTSCFHIMGRTAYINTGMESNVYECLVVVVVVVGVVVLVFSVVLKHQKYWGQKA